MAQSSAKYHSVTRRDNGLRINIFSVELSVFLVELPARAVAQSSAKNHGVTQRDNDPLYIYFLC
jgi:hypothetical protein